MSELKIQHYNDKPIMKNSNASNASIEVRDMCFLSEGFIPNIGLNIFGVKDKPDCVFLFNCDEQLINESEYLSFTEELHKLGFTLMYGKPIPEFYDDKNLWGIPPRKRGLYILNFISTINNLNFISTIDNKFNFNPNPSAEDVNRTVEVGARVKK